MWHANLLGVDDGVWPELSRGPNHKKMSPNLSSHLVPSSGMHTLFLIFFESFYLSDNMIGVVMIIRTLCRFNQVCTHTTSFEILVCMVADFIALFGEICGGVLWLFIKDMSHRISDLG